MSDIKLDPSMPPHRHELDALARSVRVYQWHDTDPYSDDDTDVLMAAATYFGVNIDDLTISQIKTWSQLTSFTRADLPLRNNTLSQLQHWFGSAPNDTGRKILDRNQNDGVLTEREWLALREVVQAGETYGAALVAAREVFK